MHFKYYLGFIFAIDCVAGAGSVRDHYVLHEKRDEASEMRKHDRLNAAKVLRVHIGLRQSNLDNAHDWLMNMSDPDSPHYGQHWSEEQVINAFQPSEDTVGQVMDWLESAGVERSDITHSRNKLWLIFHVPVKQAEGLLKTRYYEYRTSSGATVAACDEYYIPEHLQSAVDLIKPGIKGTIMTPRELKNRSSWKDFNGRLQPRKGWLTSVRNLLRKARRSTHSSDGELAHCNETITQRCIQALYKFKPRDPHAQVSPNNSLGIFEAGDYYTQKDLNSYFSNFTSSVPNGTHPKLDPIDNNGKIPSGVPYLLHDESDLDFSISIPIIYPQTTTLFQTDDYYYNYKWRKLPRGFLNTFLDAIDGSYCSYCYSGECGNDPDLDPTYPDSHKKGYKGKLMCGAFKPTNVISISFVYQEHELPASYLERQCQEFLKLGLRGVSVFVASGDLGVASNSDASCLGRKGKVFNPTIPNTCPYITSIGGTAVAKSVLESKPETAMDVLYSSGGFSNIFTIPDYQRSAVATYFKTDNPPYPYYFNGNYNTSKGVYNRNGRGFPDISAIGQNIGEYNNGAFGRGQGTSAAAPVFAALVNRIIEERIKVGKGPIGFINPTLYKNPGVLNDVVSGRNPGCGTKGFSCAKGWDPVTGLGTPNYPKMLELFLNMP